MKTLIITLEYPPQIGGIASYVYNYCKHVPPESVVVCAPVVKADKEFDKNNPWKTVRRNPYWIIWPHWLRLFLQAFNIVRREKIDQIYVHHALPSGYVAYLIKKILKVPFVVFLHGTDLEIATSNPRKRKKFSWICKEAKTVVVNSQFLKNKLLARLEGINNVRVVYPCPAGEFLQPEPPGELDTLRSKLALNGKKVIISVSRFAEGKGYPHLIRLLPEILKKVPNLVWLVIGDGPKKQLMMEMVQKNYLQNVTRFLGSIPYSELPKYYQLADLFVLLTHKDESSEEGLGTVFLEAQASGLPVVAGRVGGADEAVENLVTGLLVDIYQDASVVAAITDLLRESDYAAKMGQAGREMVKNNFVWEKQIANLNAN